MADDEELRRRLKILKEKFAEGKIVIAEHLAENFKESLGNVRYDVNGDVDLNTVDGRVRSLAMMAAIVSDRDDIKSAASLGEIQSAYFQRITEMFDEAHEIMRKSGGNPQSVSWAFSRDSEHVEQNYPLIEPFVSELTEFWEALSEPVSYHLQDLQALKGVFGGDLFPSYDQNIASSTGLYLDTIILTDPFMNTRDLFARWPKDQAVRMFLKHGLQLMNYRDLVLAETNPQSSQSCRLSQPTTQITETLFFQRPEPRPCVMPNYCLEEISPTWMSCRNSSRGSPNRPTSWPRWQTSLGYCSIPIGRATQLHRYGKPSKSMGRLQATMREA